MGCNHHLTNSLASDLTDGDGKNLGSWPSNYLLDNHLRWFESHHLSSIKWSPHLYTQHEVHLWKSNMEPQNEGFWINMIIWFSFSNSWFTSFFKVTFWFLKWRSFSPWKGHLRPPKRVTGWWNPFVFRQKLPRRLGARRGAKEIRCGEPSWVAKWGTNGKRPKHLGFSGWPNHGIMILKVEDFRKTQLDSRNSRFYQFQHHEDFS